MFVYMCNNHCHWVRTQLQLINIIIIVIVIIRRSPRGFRTHDHGIRKCTIATALWLNSLENILLIVLPFSWESFNMLYFLYERAHEERFYGIDSLLMLPSCVRDGFHLRDRADRIIMHQSIRMNLA
jgi:hypothetical protein